MRKQTGRHSSSTASSGTRGRLLALASASVLSLSVLGGAWGNPSSPFGGASSFESTAPKAGSISDGDNGVVAERGSVTYSYPIQVPPGRGGAVPSLGLSYSSA